MKNRTCITMTSGFDFTLTGKQPMSHIALIFTPPSVFLADHVISIMNAELVDMYTDAILLSLTLLTGVDIASRIMLRTVLYHQDARLQDGCAPCADPSDIGVPQERCVDVFVHQGASREQFLERSFIPF
jgi:hypothetical protein